MVYNTKIIKLNPDSFNPEDMTEAVDLIKNGEVVAFPTETVYGLGANALNAKAVERIFLAKGRPADNPLIVHISAIEQLDNIVMEISDGAKLLMKKHWPGPMTLILKKKDTVPSIVTAGLDTVAVRMPSNKIAKSLIELTRCPIAAPSANRSGKTSPTHAEHVIEDLSGRIPMIIDGGPCQAGLESTVIDLQREPPLILRPGVLTLETLKKDIPNIQYYTSSIDKGALIEKPTTPGMKYRHYCPETPMILFQSEPNQIIEKIANYLNTTNEKKIKILLTTEIDTSKFTQVKGKDIKIKQLGTINTKAEVAHNLFAALRESDHECHDVILVQGVSEVEEGKAIMNRLRKAAKKII